jgi:hypothetical protein
MRRAALLVLVALAVAGCTHPARTAPTVASAAPSTITASARPAGWKVVRYRGISFAVPASWRIRDGRKLPCPAILPGPAVVLGHSNLREPCPMPQLRRPLLWVDDRAEEPPPATAVATTINGVPVRLLRVHPATLGQAVSDELMYWSQYRRGRGFQVWVAGREVKAELLDPAGGAVVDQVLATLHRS